MILLTGSSGFLGAEIKSSFERNGIDYLTLGRSATDSIHWDLGPEFPLIPPVEVVVHAAGKAHLKPVTNSEVQSFFTTNVEGTKNLLAALESIEVKKFIFISSVAVYGLTTGFNIKEDTPLLAEDPYGKSKITAELLVQDWCQKRNILYYILRLPLVAGKNAPANLGDMIKGIKKGRYFSIGTASAKKSMVLATDVAAFIPTINGPSGIYNLTDGYHPSFQELEKKIAVHYGKKKPLSLPLQVVKLLAYAGDLMGKKFPLNSSRLNKMISSLTFNDSRAKDLLGWKSRSVLESWEIE